MIKVLTIDNKIEWDNHVKTIPNYEVFYLRDYLRVFQYKASFATHGIKEYYIGKYIINADTYDKLCALRNIPHNDTPPNHAYFPEYRIK